MDKSLQIFCIQLYIIYLHLHFLIFYPEEINNLVPHLINWKQSNKNDEDVPIVLNVQTKWSSLSEPKKQQCK